MSRKLVDEFLKDGEPPPANAGIFGGLCTAEEASLVLLPVAWDATASYGRGAVEGPEGILRASPFLDLEDLYFGRPYLAGIHMRTDLVGRFRELNEEASDLVAKLRDGAGEEESLLARVNALSEEVNRQVEVNALQALKQGQAVGVVGGDHSAPFGLIKALAQFHPEFGVLHVDAHFDLRKAYEGFTYSHASIMYNVLEHIPQVKKLVQIGIRDFSAQEKAYAEAQQKCLEVYFDRDISRAKAQGEAFKIFVDELVDLLPPKVYISFDIDGLSPLYCPSTGTPVPGGLDIGEAFYLIEELVENGREVIGFDLCEVAVPKEGDWDLNVGARVLYKLCGAVLRRHCERSEAS